MVTLRFFLLLWVTATMFCGEASAAARAPHACPAEPILIPPQSIHSNTGVTVYLESDGRHLLAFDKSGQLIWHQHQMPLGPIGSNCLTVPLLTELSKESLVEQPTFILVRFYNGGWGHLDLTTGELSYEGND